MDLTPAELTILGLVVEQARHGYELEQLIEQRGIRQWTDIGFSSIYYLLGKLQTSDLVQTAEGSTGAKSRRVFQATEKGKNAAASAALAFIAEAQPIPHPLLVGLSNMSLLSADNLRLALVQRLGQIEVRIATVKAAEELQAPLPMPAREVFSYSLSLLEAERSWLVSRVQVS
ncbi:PadR family transcriptional regulator [Psychromicrobium lacuslunae]|uniref:PadR family transcriptional regulator n=1 Tax=Psychromicrobium lacuslunae TaxID=1618207 RepID=A0A0D4C1G1_9MICC|nr:PadR family transcriptional regulator [Psychromicrobium lacuslunae]AJT42438.1 PadR family transcriptional regulator [Psychromicrobium lacuslunae]